MQDFCPVCFDVMWPKTGCHDASCSTHDTARGLAAMGTAIRIMLGMTPEPTAEEIKEHEEREQELPEPVPAPAKKRGRKK